MMMMMMMMMPHLPRISVYLGEAIWGVRAVFESGFVPRTHHFYLKMDGQPDRVFPLDVRVPSCARDTPNPTGVPHL